MGTTFSDKYRISGQDFRAIWPLLLPAMLEGVVNTMFGIADSAMLKDTGYATRAIAAVGITASLNYWVVCITTYFFIGLTVSVAQAYGSGEREKCRVYTARFLPIAAGMALFCSLVFSIGSPLFVRLMGANEEIYADAVAYFRIVSAGYLFHIFNCMVTAALRGVGITRLPMIYNLGSGALNVFLNRALIGGRFGFPALGVAGAAWATTISRGAAFVMASVLLFFGRSDVSLRGMKLLSRATKKILRQTSLKQTFIVGGTAAAEELFLQTGAVLVTKIVSILPTGDFAAYQVAANVEQLSWAIAGAFGTVTTTLAGQALGRRDLACARARIRLTWMISLGFGGVLTIAYLFAGPVLVRLYTTDAEVVALATRMMRISALTVYGIMTHSAFSGGLRGLCHAAPPLIASLISLWVCRVAGSFITVRLLSLGIFAMFLCILADQWVRALINVVLYRRMIRKGGRQKKQIA